MLDSTAVAENRISGGVGEVTGEIPLPRPDQPQNPNSALVHHLDFYLPDNKTKLINKKYSV